MGVPAFFVWLIERYPNIIRDVKPWEDEAIKGGVDNLYLDFNGIIHPCCHPEDGSPLPKDEDEMAVRVCAHLDSLVSLIAPKKLLYIATDGVAPRAKMNQQRSRRFCSAAERERAARAEVKVRREMAAEGKEVPKRLEKWDHNAITPGTPFMFFLAEKIRNHVKMRQEEASGPWERLDCIFSDAGVPGEGEHKVIEFIRRMRAEPGYDPKTSHCLCGEDADLIMLSLALHEAVSFASTECGASLSCALTLNPKLDRNSSPSHVRNISIFFVVKWRG